MGLLSKQEVAEYALKTGFIYEFVCDSPGCGKMIRPGELCVVLKWAKRTDGLQALLGRLVIKVMCLGCDEALHPKKEIVSVKNAGRGAKKVSHTTASEIQINLALRKCIIGMLKATPEGIPAAQFILRLRKKKVIREATKKELKATLQGMKTLKLYRRSKGCIMLPKEKKKKKAKVKA